MQKYFAICFYIFATIASTQAAEQKKVEHPFFLWTPAQAKELRERIESDLIARKQYEQMVARDASQHPTLVNLFKYMVMGDEAAGQVEKNKLLGFIGAQPETDLEGKWVIGNSSSTDKHMRDEQSMNVWRYDILYHQLTPEQRKGIEESFKVYIDFHLSGHKPWHPEFRYDRASWLPNMHYPRCMGTHQMAVVLQDERLIRKVFEGPGGLKWWFDQYLGDGIFYMEEFNKYYSNIGSMIQYSNALDNLGLPQYGWDYKAPHGGGMREYIEMLFYIGLPRTENPGGTPTYTAVSMGDAGDCSIFTGYDANGKGGPRWFSNAHMNGPLPKLSNPFWFEALHAKYPDGGFDYFLAQMNKPGDKLYYPSLYFGCRPVDPEKIKTGPKAPSYITQGRGFAMLRMEESGAYWESKRPAVVMQFAMYYVHYVHDCLSILNYQAFNRQMYRRMGRTGTGYAGSDAWADNVRGHASGLVVDNGQAKPVDNGNYGCPNQRIRDDLKNPQYRFVACRAKGVYPDTDLERLQMLTDEYLVDLFYAHSERERIYDWHVTAPGIVVDAKNWEPTNELDGKLCVTQGTNFNPAQIAQAHYYNCRKNQLPPNNTYTANIVHGNPEGTWPEHQTGIRVHILPDAPTMAYAGNPPGVKEGMSLMLRRNVPATVYAIVHEPYQGGPDKNPLQSVERIAQTDGAIAIRIVGREGSLSNDRVGIAWGDKIDVPMTLTDGKESLTFTERCFIRVEKDQIIAYGKIGAFKIAVEHRPKLILNGTEVPVKSSDGFSIYEGKASE